MFEKYKFEYARLDMDQMIDYICGHYNMPQPRIPQLEENHGADIVMHSPDVRSEIWGFYMPGNGFQPSLWGRITRLIPRRVQNLGVFSFVISDV